jgi:hypothetical protein
LLLASAPSKISAISTLLAFGPAPPNSPDRQSRNRSFRDGHHIRLTVFRATLQMKQSQETLHRSLMQVLRNRPKGLSVSGEPDWRLGATCAAPSTTAACSVPRSGGMSMNRIVGTVVHRESKLGIPKLLVTAFDIKPNGLCASTKPMTFADEEVLPGTRLGSVVTDVEGAFEYAFEANGRDLRPDLLLTVSAPQAAAFTVRQFFIELPAA